MAPKITPPTSAPNKEYVKVDILPQNIKTQGFNTIFDKDGNGLIERKNEYGIDELALLEPYAKKMNLDLSKYTSKEWEQGSVKNWHQVRVDNNGAKQERTEYHSTNTGFIGNSETYENGELTSTYKSTHTNSRNKAIFTGYYDRTNLTDGKYKLQSMIMESSILDDYEMHSVRSRTVYQLNGEFVKAEAIGKGRYKITTPKGKTFYISHDGFKLKNSYVESNP